ncbi:transposase [Xylella taiwanensis]|uniref:Transposase n=1 Tax=Xylella taiwanensis TaxID=1444770 RepID=Z9JKH5_9GAMM|nr:transposase [Xylella taiwanensis]
MFYKLKGYPHICSRCQKLDAIFIAFICWDLIADGLQSC